MDIRTMETASQTRPCKGYPWSFWDETPEWRLQSREMRYHSDRRPLWRSWSSCIRRSKGYCFSISNIWPDLCRIFIHPFLCLQRAGSVVITFFSQPCLFVYRNCSDGPCHSYMVFKPYLISEIKVFRSIHKQDISRRQASIQQHNFTRWKGIIRALVDVH